MIFFCPGKHAQFTARNLVDLEIVGLYLRKKNSSIRSVLVNVVKFQNYISYRMN